MNGYGVHFERLNIRHGYLGFKGTGEHVFSFVRHNGGVTVKRDAVVQNAISGSGYFTDAGQGFSQIAGDGCPPRFIEAPNKIHRAAQSHTGKHDTGGKVRNVCHDAQDLMHRGFYGSVFAHEATNRGMEPR